MKTENEQAPLMLSVSGMRGIVGESITEEVVGRYARAFGSYVVEQSGQVNPVMCVGRDSRPSGGAFESAVIDALASVGCRVVRLGIVTTPSVAVMISKHHAAGGMVVTASHNPTPWNGLKSLNADGVAPPPDVAAEVIRRFHADDVSITNVQDRPDSGDDDTTHEVHVGRVLDLVDADAIRSRGFKVVLDSVNGAGCVAGRLLLEQLGCEIIHLNGEPTGEFAHTPEPTAENLVDLARATGEHGADVGFAQDPDADRLAIIDETGHYIGEEYTLVLAAMRMLQINGPGVMAANLSTSRMIDDVAAVFPGSNVIRTAVGEANIVNAMKPAGGLVGGEGNGGVIVPSVCWVRDSLSAMALTLSLMAGEGRALSAIVDAMPRYVMVKKKYDLSAIGGRDAVGPILDRVRGHHVDMAGARINDADGVRVDFDDAWVHLRPSNTEPIVRLIGEGATRDAIDAVIAEVARIAGL